MHTKLIDLTITLAIITMLGLLFTSDKLPPGSAAPLPQHEPAQGLFTPAATAPLNQQNDSTPVIRQRYVTIDFEQLGGSEAGLTTASASDTIQLNLFDDTLLTGVLEEVTPNATGGGYVWIGKIQGEPYSQIILVVKEGTMRGDIRFPAAVYSIKPAAGNLHVIQEVGPSPVSPPIDDHVAAPDHLKHSPQSEPASLAAEPGLPSGETPVLITNEAKPVADILVLYTPAARTKAGGQAKIEAMIDLGIAQVNTAFQNSGISAGVRLVHRAETNYVESGDQAIDWERLGSPNDGFMDEVHPLRATHFADIVVLFIGATNGPFDACGGFGGAGYAVVDQQCATNSHELVFAHEVGHNFGANHDWYVNAGPGYNKGYVHLPGRWRTIMAYSRLCFTQGFFCPALLYFSNPDNLYQGTPMGVPVGTNQSCQEKVQNNPPCDADNRRVINEVAQSVANIQGPASLRLAVLTNPSIVKSSTTSIGYLIILRNEGSQQLTGLKVTNTLPSQTTFAGSVNQGGTHTNGKLTWSGLTLDGFESLSLTFNVNVKSALKKGDLLINTFEATSNEGVTIPATQLITVVDPQRVFLPAVVK